MSQREALWPRRGAWPFRPSNGPDASMGPRRCLTFSDNAWALLSFNGAAEVIAEQAS